MHYRKTTSEKKAYDPVMHCNCGAEIGSSKDYCSNFCEQKDSVWYKEDNM